MTITNNCWPIRLTVGRFLDYDKRSEPIEMFILHERGVEIVVDVVFP